MSLEKSSLLAVPVLALAASLVWVGPALSQSTATPPSAAAITMDQFVTRQTARIMAADIDGDGRISRAEMAAMAGAGKGGHDPSRRFDAMDTNHDGCLDKAEIRAALKQRFHRMDANGDGVLTPDERMAGRTRHDQPGPATMSPAAQPDQ